MVRLAGVKSIRYIGSEPKKLWEVGGRNVPILESGDVVLVGETVALSLCRGRFFIPVNVEITADVEPLEEISSDENPPADLEAEALAKAEAETKVAEEAEALAKAETETKAAEEAEALAKAEAETKVAEEAEALAKAEAETKAAEEVADIEKKKGK